MALVTGDQARYNVRLLLPGPDDALREAIERTGAEDDALQLLARHGAVEAIALDNLRGDEIRVTTRFVQQNGGCVITDQSGERAVVLAPLHTAGNLANALREWGRATESLGDAVAAVLMGRYVVPTWIIGGNAIDLSVARVIAADAAADVDTGDEVLVRSIAADIDVGPLWTDLAVTDTALLLASSAADIADRCSSLRGALGAAAAAGVDPRRTAVVVAADAAENRQSLRRIGQVRSLMRPLVADIRGEVGSPVAVAVTAVLGGAHAVHCNAADVAAIRLALTATAAVS